MRIYSVSFIVDQIDPQDGLRSDIASCLARPTAARISAIYGQQCQIDVSEIERSLIEEIPYRASDIREFGPIDDDKLQLFRDVTSVFGREEGFRRPLAEFHGLILSTNAAMGRSSDTAGKLLQPAPPIEGLSRRLSTFVKRRERFIKAFVGTDWHSDVIGDGGAVESDALGAEAVVCGMLGGAALYASPITTAARHRNRVNYLVAYDGSTEAQLGRFVHRLHVMGELRLSALMDYDVYRTDEVDDPTRSGPATRVRNLVQAGQEIRRIGKTLTALEASLSVWPYRDNGDRSDLATRLNAHFDALNDEQTHFYGLNRCASGRLVFRVERSRYYAEAYRNRLLDLRVVRMEGWQPYDAFARRYVLPLYENIAGIGSRYASLGRRLDRLQSLLIGRGILLQTEATRGQTVSSNRLLERAEDIGFIAAIYYAFSTLSHVHLPWAWVHEALPYVAAGLLALHLYDTIRWGRAGRNAILRRIERHDATPPTDARARGLRRLYARGSGTDNRWRTGIALARADRTVVIL